MANSLKEESIKTQFNYLNLFNLIALCLIGIIGISGALVTKETMSNKIEISMYGQIEDHLDNLISENTALFKKRLQRNTEGFLLPIKNAANDVTRQGYSMANVQSYYEYGNPYLAQPLGQDSRYDYPVSFSHSSYYVPNTTPSDIPTFSTSLNKSINLSAHIDPYFKQAYKNNIDFVAGYVGYEGSGLFRQYPGIDTLTSDPTRSYNPTVRGWYKQALNLPTKVIYTPPYEDFNGKGWMITLATVVKDGNTVIGVAGSDMLISTIDENLQNINFFETGKMSLFDIGGNVISDNEWKHTGEYSYMDLQQPTITDELWSKMTNSALNVVHSQNYTDGSIDYIVGYSKVEVYENVYIVTAIVPSDEVYRESDIIVGKIENISDRVLYITLGIVCAVIVVVLIISYNLMKGISDQITSYMDISDKVVGNIGGGDLMKGVDQSNQHGAGISEFNQFNNVMGNVIQGQHVNYQNAQLPHQNSLYDINKGNNDLQIQKV